MARALIYKHKIFPRVRKASLRAPKPDHLSFIVTSYQMTSEINAAVYSAVFEEIAVYGVPAFVAACVTDQADVSVITRAFNARHDLPPETQVMFLFQSGQGKRAAMADALRAIRQQSPSPSSQVILMDGDTVLGQNALAKTCSVLASQPTVGAVTTDNVPWVKGSVLAREWYRVRMAHRDNLMCSMSLSRKLLVLTGRFSVFRSELALTDAFLAAIEEDVIDHPRLGRIAMLTGDDKSTWFEAIRNGWDMLYAPDIVVHPIEQLPAKGFLKPTVALMSRWYGNMARNNGRALSLGPSRCGGFVWLCLLDQRISMWTSLVGIVAAVALSARHGVAFLIYYFLWVLLSRGVLSVFYYVSAGRLHPLFPFVLYYNQVIGALVKIHAMFHPDRQCWTRQGIKGRDNWTKSVFSQAYMLVTVAAFVLLLVIWTGTLLDPLRAALSSGSAIRPSHTLAGCPSLARRSSTTSPAPRAACPTGAFRYYTQDTPTVQNNETELK